MNATITQTQNAQELGQYKSTSVNTLKSVVDFTIEQMNPIYIRFNSGESKIVTKRELSKMQSSMIGQLTFNKMIKNTTPFEKAMELNNKYYKLLFLCETTRSIGIKCSIIAVDELIDYARPNHVTIGRGGLTDLEFWNGVKTELEKMLEYL